MDNIQNQNNNSDDGFSIILTPREIADKQFDTRFRGFDKDQVNEFLDDIIKDYENYVNEVQRLSEENQRLVRRTDELSKQLTVAKQVGGNKTSAATNYDILKRISNLERKVFGLKLDNSD